MQRRRRLQRRTDAPVRVAEKLASPFLLPKAVQEPLTCHPPQRARSNAARSGGREVAGRPASLITRARRLLSIVRRRAAWCSMNGIPAGSFGKGVSIVRMRQTWRPWFRPTVWFHSDQCMLPGDGRDQELTDTRQKTSRQSLADACGATQGFCGGNQNGGKREKKTLRVRAGLEHILRG